MSDRTIEVSGPPAFMPEHPGAILREEFLRPAQLPVKDAAERLGVTRQTLHRVLAGDSTVTAEMALRLSRLTGTSAAFWLNLQAQHDLWQHERSMARELRRIASLRIVHLERAPARAKGRAVTEKKPTPGTPKRDRVSKKSARNR
jgi:antitoxin HigA-1